MNVGMVCLEGLIGFQVHEKVGSMDHQMAEVGSFEAIRSPKYRPAPCGFLKPCCQETPWFFKEMDFNALCGPSMIGGLP